MSPDINLLPDERRRAEERELSNPRGSSTGQPLYSAPNVAPAAGTPPGTTAAVPPLPEPAQPAKLRVPLPTSAPAAAPRPKRAPGPSFAQRLRSLLGRSSAAEPAAPAPGGINLDVNLIPQEGPARVGFGQWPLVGAAAGAAAAVAVAFIGLGLAVAGSQRGVLAAQDEAAATAQRLLGQQQAVEEMSRAVEQVRSVSTLLDAHVYWNRYFVWLESVTLPDVYYSGFMGDVAGTFTLNASARDYVTLAQQLVVLRADPLVQRVAVSEASRDSQGWVNYTMSLSVSPKVLLQIPE